MEEKGYEINPYDPCVENEIIDGSNTLSVDTWMTLNALTTHHLLIQHLQRGLVGYTDQKRQRKEEKYTITYT